MAEHTNQIALLNAIGPSGIADLDYQPETVIPALVLTGTDDADNLQGTGSPEFLDAGIGDDTQHGQNGDDVILLTKGADKNYGGSGDDTAIFPGDIDDYSGLVLSGSDVHVVTAFSSAPIDTGTDRLKAFETFEFRDALMNARTGEVVFKTTEAPAGQADIALTVGITETGVFGNRFLATSDTDGIITATFANPETDVEVSLTGFDIDFDTEVEVKLNGLSLGFLSVGPNEGFNAGDRFMIDAGNLIAGDNTLNIEQTVNPNYVWGFTDLRVDILDPPATDSDIALAIGVVETGEFGNKFNGAIDDDGIITASFTSPGTDLNLSLTGYDVDFASEVEVLLNSQSLGFLSVGPNEQLNGGDSFLLPAGDQQAGVNILTIQQAANPNYVWGFTDLLLQSGEPGDALLVTTLADTIAADGDLSLREAIIDANARPGNDTISFASNLFGGTINLTSDLPIITDALSIDGDLANRGAGGIHIDGGYVLDAGATSTGYIPFQIDGTQVVLEDLSITHSNRFAVDQNNADVSLIRSRIDLTASSPDGFFTRAVNVVGGSFELVDSTIADTVGYDWAAIAFDDATVSVERSTIDGAYLGYLGESQQRGGIIGQGSLTIESSEIVDNMGVGLRVGGTTTIRNSYLGSNGFSIEDFGTIDASGLLVIENSTIANSQGIYAINLQADADAQLTHTTLTGTRYTSRSGPNSIDINQGFAIRLDDDATLRLENSIVLDHLPRGVDDNGSNIVDVDDDAVFALTDTFANGQEITGVVADNGGPTKTIALLASAGNPAIDGASPDDAPATDQRGETRLGGPDIGAFELQVRPDAGFEVTTLADTIAFDGELSLREAIDNANLNPGLDQITFASDVQNGVIELTRGAFQISDDIVISSGLNANDGDGNHLEISANGSAIFQSSTADMTISGILIDGERPFSATAVYAMSSTSGDITLEQSTITNTLGPAVSSQSGDITISDSTLHQNIQRDYSYSAVGAVHNEFGAISIKDSTISESAYVGVLGQKITIDNSSVTGSDFGYFADSVGVSGDEVQITNSVISDNKNFGVTGREVTIVNSIVSNTIGGTNYFGSDLSAGILASQSLTLTGSTITNNVSAYGGGGIILGSTDPNQSASAIITNSTIADNLGGGSGIVYFENYGEERSGKGGGIYLRGTADVEIVNSTITGNVSRVAGGGGIFGNGSSNIDLANSIVVGNADADGAQDVDGNLNSSNGANLFGQNALLGTSVGDQTNIAASAIFEVTGQTANPAVPSGIIADNGGPTPTAALLNSSSNPAIDKALVIDAPPTDQRGAARDGPADIGSFELQGLIPVGIDLVLVKGVVDERPFGNRYAGQSDEDGIITVAFDHTGGDALLTLKGYDIDFASEVEVRLNGTALGNLSIGPNEQLNAGDRFEIGAADQLPGLNTLSIVQTSNPTYIWGFTDILIDDASPISEADISLIVGQTENGDFGNRLNGLSDSDGVITASFENPGSDVNISLDGYDIDFATEVEVLLNGTPLGFLSVGPNEQFNTGDSFLVDASALIAGSNIVTIQQTANPNYVWGFSNLLVEDNGGGGGERTLADLFPNKQVLGTSGVDDLDGTDLNEVVDALTGDDNQHGQNGDDFIIIGAGRDKNYGGSGLDVAVFSGEKADFSGISGIKDTYLIDDNDVSDGNLGFDRVKGIELFAFNDAIFDTRTGQMETFSSETALVNRLEDLINSGLVIS